MRFRSLIYLVVIIAVCFFIFRPVKLIKTPEIYGVLKENKKPLAGVKIYISKSSDIRKPCENPVKVSITNSLGEFYIKKIEYDEYFPFILNEVEYVFQLNNICIGVKNNIIFAGEVITKVNQANKINLYCNTMDRSISASLAGLYQICKAI